MTDEGVTPDACSFPPARQAAYAITVLAVVTTTAYLDRQLPALLVQPLKQAFGVSDTQISLLQGMAFVIFNTTAGIPLGLLVDRTNRHRLIIVGVAVWSVLTILSGLAAEFRQLIVLRMGVGIAEACLIPAATSMIGDYVPRQTRARALSFYYIAQSLGAGASLFFGAVIIAVLGKGGATIPGIGPLAPWRLTFIAAGLPGLAGVALMLTTREPARREAASADRNTSATTFRHYFAQNRGTYVRIFASYTLLAFVAYGTSAWMPTFYQRQFGVTIGSAGMTIGLITVVCGMMGALLGGFLSDWWRARVGPGGRLRVLMISWSVLAVTLPAWPMVETLWASYALLAVVFFGMTVGTSSVASVFQEMTPNELRGQVMAITMLLAGLLGAGLGPLVVAQVTDHVFRTESGLRYGLLVVPVPVALLGALLTWSAFGRYRRSAETFAGQGTTPLTDVDEHDQRT
jgi:MFS family permease